MIRPYADSDWGDVCTVYDLSKPDEMAGIVDASVIAPLADDEKMRPYFFASDIWVYEEDGRV
ncbi:MAG: N-acetyltransferase, partial [bacterium]|nr:N-acetyltransferase [bacterium]